MHFEFLGNEIIALMEWELASIPYAEVLEPAELW